MRRFLPACVLVLVMSSLACEIPPPCEGAECPDPGDGGQQEPPVSNLICGVVTADGLTVPSAVPFGRFSANGVCVPVRSSNALDRAELRLLHAQCLVNSGAVAPGAGTFNLQRSPSGQLLSVTFQPVDGNAEGFLQTFQWAPSGQLLQWTYDFSGASEDLTETFAYDTNGRILQWRRSHAGNTPDVGEFFAYASNGQLTQWNRTFEGAAGGITEVFAYASNGQLTQWTRTAQGSPTGGQTEYFAYLGDGKLQQWTRDYADATPDGAVFVTYDANGNVQSATGTGGAQGTVEVGKCSAATGTP